MQGVNFHGATTVLDPPPGEEKNVGKLHVQIHEEEGHRVFTSIWEPSDEEREVIAQGGVVQLDVWALGFPPVAVNAIGGGVINRHD